MVYLLGVAKSKVQTEVLDEFLFAENMTDAIGVDQRSYSCDSYNLTISIKMTEMVYQPELGKPYQEPTITVKSQ